MLHDVSLSIAPGRMLALVGPTGSGKSTLAALVAKLYQPTGGRVLIDGNDLRIVTSASLHRHIACVTQENFLFSGTILDNIRVGQSPESATLRCAFGEGAISSREPPHRRGGEMVNAGD